MDESDAGRAGLFSQCTNWTQAAQVYSRNGPIGRSDLYEVHARGEEVLKELGVRSPEVAHADHHRVAKQEELEAVG
eukprot:1125410-Pyramimonas_sp.AAC.1